MEFLLVAVIVSAGLLPAPAAPHLERGRGPAVRPGPAVLVALPSPMRRPKALEHRPETVLAPPPVTPGDRPAPAAGPVYEPPSLAPRSPRATPSSQRDPPGSSPVG